MQTRAKTVFDVDKIHQNYKLVIADFGRINATIDSQRDSFDETLAGKLLQAYDWLNKHLASASPLALLAPQDMLELNMIVHMGTDPAARGDYQGFISYTEEKFARYSPALIEWFNRQEGRGANPYTIAAGLYVRVLARPQLFSDGNHRTGSLIANYYLLTKDQAPFILTCDNAVNFLNLASDVKFKRDDIWSNFKRAVGWRDESARMRRFLQAHVQPFTRGAIVE